MQALGAHSLAHRSTSFLISTCQHDKADIPPCVSFWTRISFTSHHICKLVFFSLSQELAAERDVWCGGALGAGRAQLAEAGRTSHCCAATGRRNRQNERDTTPGAGGLIHLGCDSCSFACSPNLLMIGFGQALLCWDYELQNLGRARHNVKREMGRTQKAPEA